MSDLVSDTDVLCMIPPNLNYPPYIITNTTTNNNCYKRAPRQIYEWNDFTNAVATLTVPTELCHKRTSFNVGMEDVWTKDHVNLALKRNVFGILNQLKFHNGEFTAYNAIPGVVGRPDCIFVEDGVLRFVIENRIRSDLHVPDDVTLITMYNNGVEKVLNAVCHIFGYMLYNRCRFGVLTTYDQTWFLKRVCSTLYISPTITHDNRRLTLYQCYAYIISRANLYPFSTTVGDDILVDSSDRTKLDLGNIYISGILGRGRTGTIFHGELHDKKVAVKICDTFKAPDLESAMLNEVEIYNIMRNLQGDCIPKLIAYGYDGFLFVLVTEVAGSPSRKEEMGSHERRSAVDKLARIHTYGIAHRDLHWNNILIQHCSTGVKNIMFIDFERSARVDKERCNMEMSYLFELLDIPAGIFTHVQIKKKCFFIHTVSFFRNLNCQSRPKETHTR